MMIVLEIAVLNNPGSVIGEPVTFDATMMMGNQPAIGNGRLPSQQSVVRQVRVYIYNYVIYSIYVKILLI